MKEFVKKTTLISVIIPAYNAEKYLAEAISSILTQSFVNIEVIVIDDCSTDRTWEIIQHYALTDSRIRSFRNETNLGIAGNRNKGIKLAMGKYILWQDADDISLPERIEKQLNFMEANPDVGIVGGFLQFFSDEKAITGIRKYSAGDAELRQKIFRFSPVAQPAAMIRKSCIDEVGEYDLRFPPAEDLDMSFRIGIRYKFANIQDVIIKYREHPHSATFSRLKKIELSTLMIRLKYARSPKYNATWGDYVYSSLQFFSIWIIAPELKIKIFNWWRNTNSI